MATSTLNKMTVRGRQRYDGSRYAKASRYQGRGGRKPGCEQRERPAGVWLESQRKDLFGKLQDMDVPLEGLHQRKVQLYWLTINNPRGDSDKWLRGSDIMGKLRRTLAEHVYRDSDDAPQSWWVEEFGDENRPHAHALVAVPAPLYAEPRWRGKTYESPGQMLEAIGRAMIARANPDATPHQLGVVAKATRVVALTKAQLISKIRGLHEYMAKVGDHEDGAHQKSQDLSAEKVWTNDRAMSGYWGIGRVKDSEILAVDEEDEVGVLAVLAEAGWSLSEGDAKPRRGGVVRNVRKLMSAGAVVGRRAWVRLVAALDGCGQWLDGMTKMFGR